MSQLINTEETAKTRARYNRIAPVYDLMEIFTERRFIPWRTKLWSLIPSGRFLEVGIGTGKNLPYHPAEAEVTGIDLSNRMLVQAHQKAEKLGHPISLREMDAQQLDFRNDSFEAAVATFVFCSVPDPERGLRELVRVVKPDGQIVLLEHVRIERPPLIGKLMDWLNPLVVQVMGAHINRRTAEAVRQSGLEIEEVEDLAPLGLVKLITARRPSSNGRDAHKVGGDSE